MSVRSVLALGLLFYCLAVFGQSQNPANNSQEAAVIEKQLTRVHFENDGTSVEETTAVVHIQSEAALQAYGQLVFGYSSATENLSVDYVRVRKPDGQVIETPASNAQDFAPDVLQSAPMYSDFREHHVNVVGLRPGDILEYKTTIKTFTPLAAGQFWYEYEFPKYRAVNEARLEIEVPKSREIKLKSPDHKYTTSENGDWRVYTWVAQNITPDRKAETAREEQEEEDSESEFPDVQMTSFSDWKQVAAWYGQLQGERVVVDDSIRKKTAELTAGASTETEKARRLYDYVARDFRYVSLSFGVGRYQPHAATEILHSGYGDCKDKHTLLAAMLKAAGISSYPVLIGFGRKLDPDIPSPAQFNHVITAARLGGKLTFLDATAEIAPFGLLMYGLRDKQAVLASGDSNGGLIKTTADVPVKNSLAYVINGKVSETGTLDATIEIKASGDSDLPLRATFRSLSQADWQRFAKVLWLSRSDKVEVSDINVSSIEDTTKPIEIRFHVHQDNYFTVPGADENFFPFAPLAFARIPKSKTTTEPLDVGPAREFIYKTHLQFASNFTLLVPAQVAMSRDYGEYSTTFEFQNHVLDAERKLVLKVNQLPPSRRGDIESFQGVAANIASQTIGCSIRPASAGALAVQAPAGADLKELRRTATKALEQRDYQAAADLFKQAVAQDPKSDDDWYNLGRAYNGLNDHAKALAAFQKQVEVNPYHKRAYDDLGVALEDAGQNDDAIVAYRKQLDNVPLDRVARKNLGLLLLKLKRDKEALPELENAATVPPEDSALDLALAQAYLRTGANDKAHALLVKIVGNSSPFPGGDIFAAALRDDVDPDATLRDAQQMLDNISQQFESNAFVENDATSTMEFVALAWARLGWAKFLKGQSIEALRYLKAAWALSESGTVANRLGRFYEKVGQPANAKHMYALAVACGGVEADASRAQLQKLDSLGSEKLLSQAKGELAQMRTVKLPNSAKKTGQADFELVFDGEEKPEQVQYRSGDAQLRALEAGLTNATYPVQFPDVSGVKIVRRGTVACAATGCAIVLNPVSLDANLVSGF